MKNKPAMRLIRAFLLIALFCAVFALSAFALTEGDYEYSIANSEATITKYLGSGGDVVIPEKIRGCTVVKIGEKAFAVNYKYSATITSVVIPDTVREIGDYAFQNQNITSFNFPASIEKIGVWAFAGCDTSGTLVIPANAANAMSRTSWQSGDQFRNNKKLEAVVIEEGAEFIIGDMFMNCTALKSVTLPSTITIIKVSAFDGCSSLAEITIPAKVTAIEKSAFASCTSLSSVTFAVGSKLETIAENAFECTAIKTVYLPNTLKTLGQLAFDECSQLTGLVIPASVESIYNSIFWSKCNELKWVCVSSSTKVGEGTGWLHGAPNAIVYCEAGSTAEQNCIKQGYSYISDSSASTPIQVIYNGERVAFGAYGANPQIINDRTMVPLRSIFEAMGASVEWDGATRTVTSTRGSVTVKLTINGSEMLVNGKAIALDSPAVIRNDRTLVPVRAIAEAFGAKVEWNANGKLVLISE